jgi:hypothetical protein
VHTGSSVSGVVFMQCLSFTLCGLAGTLFSVDLRLALQSAVGCTPLGRLCRP